MPICAARHGKSRNRIVPPDGATKQVSVGSPVKTEDSLFADSTLPPGLIQAYVDTHYKVPGLDLTLVIDQRNPALDQAHRQHQVDCSAFITACNPYSAGLSTAENKRRQRNLALELRSRNRSFTDGIGQHPSNDWAGGPSFLDFGLMLEEAKTLCTKLEQNGFVRSGADPVPNLILLK
ncbi:MAG: DUF3293 domain-containing protein [Candidatus Kapabacteria bacterium]|nr:DUF3293 domain-containing protein [Candidatus Kapabacteria bacterium]